MFFGFDGVDGFDGFVSVLVLGVELPFEPEDEPLELELEPEDELPELDFELELADEPETVVLSFLPLPGSAVNGLRALPRRWDLVPSVVSATASLVAGWDSLTAIPLGAATGAAPLLAVPGLELDPPLRAA